MHLVSALQSCKNHCFFRKGRLSPLSAHLMFKVLPLPHYYLLPELTDQEVSVQDQELAVFMEKVGDPATAASNVFDRLIDYMPLPPASEDGSLTEVPSIEFTKVRDEK